MVRLGAAIPALLGVCAAVTACSDPDTFSGDPFPIEYVSRAGAVTVEVRASGELTRPAVLDVLAPLTVLDNGPDTAPARRSVSLDLLGVAPAGGTVPRARFHGTIVQFHPCPDASCGVGDAATPFPVTATIGTDVLSGDALRFDFGSDQLFVLPDIAGDAAARTALCDGVFLRPFQGAGTLVLEGAEVAFTSRRIVVEACMGPSTSLAQAPSKRGADALFVISTGLGANIMSESAYLRYADGTTATVPDLASLPDTTVQIVSGPIAGRLGGVSGLAIVATAPKNPRGPCNENVASTYVERADPNNICPIDVANCPCADQGRACTVPAVLRLSAGAFRDTIPFVIVPDADPVLQALRAELRPLVGEIDGIIGTNVLESTELDIDYPHDRLLWRCNDPSMCQARPQLDGITHQDDLKACIAGAPAQPISRGER
jgi:hypothetical protein